MTTAFEAPHRYAVPVAVVCLAGMGVLSWRQPARPPSPSAVWSLGWSPGPGMTRAPPGVAAHMSPGARRLRFVGRLALVLVTLLCLSSMGGAMLVAFPVLVPLHWLAARNSGPYSGGGWALLAALSVFEAGWMLVYLATRSASLGLAVGVIAAIGVAASFLLGAAGRAAAHPPGA